jgi:hypothetical protein
MTLRDRILTDLDDVFFNTDDFAEALTYTPAGGTAKTINGIFREPYQAMNPVTAEVEATVPYALVKTADLAAGVRGTIARADGSSYTIIETRPEAFGLTRLILEEAS